MNNPDYGSIDSNSANLAKNNEQSHGPPKPAVRQRTKLVGTNQNSPTNLGKTEPEQLSVVHLKDVKRADAGKTELQSTENQQDSVKNQHTSKGSSLLPLSTQPPIKRPYPKKVLFIVANEFCERFSYYGLRTVLVLYFRGVLNFSDSSSTVSFHIFASLCYLTPILGAILGDSIWGKFKTILYLSIIYLIGELVLVISSIFWDMKNFSVSITFFGLLLISIGTGGIKPCVSALGGDQFLPHEDKRRQAFFSLFYGAINLGSLISMFLTPILRSDFQCVNRTDCYPYAFGLPCALMFASIILFLMAKDHYNLVPLPEKNVIVAFCQCNWLALKRKIAGYKLPDPAAKDLLTPSPTDYASNSSLSTSSHEDEAFGKSHLIWIQNGSHKNGRPADTRADSKMQNHFLYLASDKFDYKSIEEFRVVLSILLLLIPIPIYWCLFDQQGSLWTLQAARMDGRVFNTDFVLQPDQMSVANPLLLLLAIPVFEMFIYPGLRRYNMLVNPIHRITVGGLLAGLTFVISALIEVHIQSSLPPIELIPGQSNLLLINGINGCTINFTDLHKVNSTILNPIDQTIKLIEPLKYHSLTVPTLNESSVNIFRLKLKLAEGQNGNKTVGCSFNTNMEHEFSVGPLEDKSIKMIYFEQGNGKLTYRMFNESLSLPPASRARVRLLYEFFGSSAHAAKRNFYLVRLLPGQTDMNFTREKQLPFDSLIRDGQVLLSGYMDVDVPTSGGTFLLKTNDSLLDRTGGYKISLKPGTRNLLLVHQKDAFNLDIKQQLLQDNDYRVSMLYQLAPYLMISVSEVMFSITGLEFSYSMAPDSMKSIILGAWSLTTAFGNLLTVAFESLHIFSNIAHDFLFYALIMMLDMVLFAFIGHYYKPYKAQVITN